MGNGNSTYSYRRNKLAELGYPDTKDLTREDVDALWEFEGREIKDISGNARLVTDKNKYEHLRAVQEPKCKLTIEDINLLCIKGHAPVTYRFGKPTPLPPGVSEEMALELP